MSKIHWQVPVDLDPPQGEIFIHCGSPLVTAANTVIVPVKTGENSFRVEAHNGATGARLWVLNTAVASYHGTSTYLIMTKYNNYLGVNTGDGKNKIAILDPNATENDPVIPTTLVMNEVITQLGVYPRWRLSRRREGMVYQYRGGRSVY